MYYLEKNGNQFKPSEVEPVLF
jgi:hypothetical protein